MLSSLLCNGQNIQCSSLSFFTQIRLTSKFLPAVICIFFWSIHKDAEHSSSPLLHTTDHLTMKQSPKRLSPIMIIAVVFSSFLQYGLQWSCTGLLFHWVFFKRWKRWACLLGGREGWCASKWQYPADFRSPSLVDIKISISLSRMKK